MYLQGTNFASGRYKDKVNFQIKTTINISNGQSNWLRRIKELATGVDPLDSPDTRFGLRPESTDSNGYCHG